MDQLSFPLRLTIIWSSLYIWIIFASHNHLEDGRLRRWWQREMIQIKLTHYADWIWKQASNHSCIEKIWRIELNSEGWGQACRCCFSTIFESKADKKKVKGLACLLREEVGWQALWWGSVCIRSWSSWLIISRSESINLSLLRHTHAYVIEIQVYGTSDWQTERERGGGREVGHEWPPNYNQVLLTSLSIQAMATVVVSIMMMMIHTLIAMSNGPITHTHTLHWREIHIDLEKATEA